ncbi:MAG: tetratricopeptide repeat protein [Cyanobacteria bacterium P01_D01_bin.56]
MKFNEIVVAFAIALGFLGLNAVAARGNEPQNRSFVPPAYPYESLVDQPRPASYWQQVGANAAVVGDYQNALVALNKAVDLTGASDPNILEQRGWIHYRLENEHLAAADLRTAAALYLADQSYESYLNARNMLNFVDG